MGKFIDLTGERFGRLVVLEFSHKDNNTYYWKCKCDCGNIKLIDRHCLRSGNTKSCGCLISERMKTAKYFKTHGMSKTKIYFVWSKIKKRCYDPNDNKYKNYGGRGISMCNEWKNDFICFYDWAINNGYKEGLSIDRKDNNGNYEPLNCRFVTNYTQCRNKTTNIYYTYKNKTMIRKDWADLFNMDVNTLANRINKYGLENVFNKLEKERKQL